MSEQRKILEMIQNGRMTAAEGMMRLEELNANRGIATGVEEPAVPAVRRRYKFLKIRVTSDNKSVNVNATVPIRLLSAIGGFAGMVISYIPAETRVQMEARGINLADIDYGKVIQEIVNGTLDDPSIIEVETWDEGHQATVKVSIYVE